MPASHDRRCASGRGVTRHMRMHIPTVPRLYFGILDWTVPVDGSYRKMEGCDTRNVVQSCLIATSVPKKIVRSFWGGGLFFHHRGHQCKVCGRSQSGIFIYICSPSSSSLGSGATKGHESRGTCKNQFHVLWGYMLDYHRCTRTCLATCLDI